jgi:hypothetical protein
LPGSPGFYGETDFYGIFSIASGEKCDSFPAPTTEKTFWHQGDADFISQ